MRMAAVFAHGAAGLPHDPFGILPESLLRDPALSWAREMEGYGAQALVLENLELLFELLPERARGDASQLAF